MERDLTEGERRLMGHISMFGSDGYPVRKLSPGKWIWGDLFGVKGPPVVFKTKKAAVASFETFMDVLRTLAGQEAYKRAFADRVAYYKHHGASEAEAIERTHAYARMCQERAS